MARAARLIFGTLFLLFAMGCGAKAPPRPPGEATRAPARMDEGQGGAGGPLAPGGSGGLAGPAGAE